MVIDCLMLYMEYKWERLSFLKLCHYELKPNTIHVDPFFNQDLYNGKCLLVVCNKGLKEVGKASVNINTSFLLSGSILSTVTKFLIMQGEYFLATVDQINKLGMVFFV